MKRRKALTGLSSPLLKNPHNVFGNGDRQDGKRSEHAEPPHALRLLRARRERPSRRADEERDEFASVAHSITSSARACFDNEWRFRRLAFCTPTSCLQ
jgi:hypothetical protein